MAKAKPASSLARKDRKVTVWESVGTNDTALEAKDVWEFFLVQSNPGGGRMKDGRLLGCCSFGVCCCLYGAPVGRSQACVIALMHAKKSTAFSKGPQMDLMFLEEEEEGRRNGKVVAGTTTISSSFVVVVGRTWCDSDETGCILSSVLVVLWLADSDIGGVSSVSRASGGDCCLLANDGRGMDSSSCGLGKRLTRETATACVMEGLDDGGGIDGAWTGVGALDCVVQRFFSCWSAAVEALSSPDWNGRFVPDRVMTVDGELSWS